MISIQWFHFPVISFYFSTNYIFLTMFLLPYLYSYFIICKNILSLPFLFFPSSSSFFFTFFPHFPLSFSLLAPFPQFGLPFPKSVAPMLPDFLLPCTSYVFLKWDKAYMNRSCNCKLGDRCLASVNYVMPFWCHIYSRTRQGNSPLYSLIHATF